MDRRAHRAKSERRNLSANPFIVILPHLVRWHLFTVLPRTYSGSFWKNLRVEESVLLHSTRFFASIRQSRNAFSPIFVRAATPSKPVPASIGRANDSFPDAYIRRKLLFEGTSISASLACLDAAEKQLQMVCILPHIRSFHFPMVHPLFPDQATVWCHPSLTGYKMWKHTNVLIGTKNDIAKVTNRGRIRGGEELTSG